MIFYKFYFFCIVLIIFLNFFLKKKDYLISETGDLHQKFSSKNKVPLTGGIFIFISLVIFIFVEDRDVLYFYFHAFLILILGLFSDLKLIQSAKKRFFFQILIVISFILICDIELNNTKIYFLDKFLSNNIFNVFFLTFSILIVINGSNFLDGLNTLNVGYHLSIFIVLLYLDRMGMIDTNQILLINVILVLFFVFILNLINQIYLGDSGSYLLGFLSSIFLVHMYNVNQNISPFFIVLLLWYPCFETLFSIIRKNVMNKSPLYPDIMHLHQHIFFIIKNKFKFKILFSNIISALIINAYNVFMFFIATNFVALSQVQILLIIFNILLYTYIYFKIFIIRFKKYEK